MRKTTLLVVLAAILLCACSKSGTGSERITGRLTVEGGRVCGYTIDVPKDWTGKVETREEGNIVFFDFASSPKNTLFSISALTETQWQAAQQDPGQGIEIKAQDGIVFIYHVALDNPYTGNQAEEFQKMAGQVKSIVKSLTVSTRQ